MLVSSSDVGGCLQYVYCLWVIINQEIGMRANSHANARKASQSSAIQGECEFTFENGSYAFPNDPQICKKCKSFVTQLQITGGQLSQFHNKKLSLVNRSHFIIKLKQIKREDDPQEDQDYYRYLLYYEAVPYSLAFVKASEMASPLAAFKLEKALKEVVNDLVEFNIFSELTIEHCGFTEQGEFRVYVPPLHVLNDRKLTSAEKQRMNAAASNVLRYWQSERQPTNQVNSGPTTSRQSYRFNSPQSKKEPAQVEPTNNKIHRLSEQNTDIKKTIKLSKNYIRELNDKAYDTEKQHELKKHKSMEFLLRQEERAEEQKTGNHFLSKIDQLNKKLTNIRQALINKKSTDHPRESLENFISREKEKSKKNINPCLSPPKIQEQNYLQQVIFEKKEEQIRQQKQLMQSQKYQASLQRHQQPPPRQREQDRQSIDTYLQQIGNQYKMPKFAPNSQLRNTTLPTELQVIKNSLLGKEKQSKSNWHHESAGNIAFKRFIQKNKEIYPQLSNEPRSPTSLSKISAPQDRKSKGFKKEASQQRLKKMVSLDNFELHAETKSINLSQFSNELSNVKRRKEKQDRNRIMKHKIQDILMKSKKAIELLKGPPIKLKK